jgi:hypothetical protein
MVRKSFRVGISACSPFSYSERVHWASFMKTPIGIHGYLQFPVRQTPGGSVDEISQCRRPTARFSVNSEQDGHLETGGQEDQIPMTLDTLKISELVVHNAEILLGAVKGSFA